LPISKDENNRPYNCRGLHRFFQNRILFVVKFQKSVTYIPHLRYPGATEGLENFKVKVQCNGEDGYKADESAKWKGLTGGGAVAVSCVPPVPRMEGETLGPYSGEGG
jgi:hypothetical protein